MDGPADGRTDGRTDTTSYRDATAHLKRVIITVTVRLILQTVIYYFGYVLWVPCSIFQSSCSIDVLYFPFDEQTCEMIFGSWTYNSKQV